MAFRRSWVLSDERWQFETVESVKRFATVCTLLWPLTGMQDSDVTIYVLSKLAKFKKSRAFCVAHFLTPFPIGCQQVRFASPYPQNRELIPISKKPVSAPAGFHQVLQFLPIMFYCFHNNNNGMTCRPTDVSRSRTVLGLPELLP